MTTLTPIHQAQSTNITSLYTLHTQYHADVIDAIPEYFYHRETTYSKDPLIAVGNYQLDEKRNEKVGCIYLYQHNTSTNTLYQHQQLSTSAIFDLRWSYQSVGQYTPLATADTKGQVTLYSLISSSGRYELTPMVSTMVPESISCLSLDWNNQCHATDSPMLAVSQANGCISLYTIRDNTAFDLIRHISPFKHQDGLEIWSVAFNAHEPHLLYSGDDDKKLMQYDTRTTQHTSLTQVHAAGVCTVNIPDTSEHTLITGSYDEYIRVFDLRNTTRPLVQMNMKGGVWRIRMHPHVANLLVAACMHNGVHCITLDPSQNDNRPPISLLASNYSHQSLSYGCDWIDKSHEDSTFILSCSFYDNLLHLWKPIHI